MDNTLQKPKLPRWLKQVNKVVVFLNKRGLAVGTMHILTTIGRKSGNPVSNPVSLLILNDNTYICTVGDTDWVQNARINPSVTLQRGHQTQKVILNEIPQDGRAPILREFPGHVPGGIQFFKSSLGISGSPQSFADAADRGRVFEVKN